jgi:hypothetical protein
MQQPTERILATDWEGYYDQQIEITVRIESEGSGAV